MLSSSPEHDAVRHVAELEIALSEVELQLAALGQALKDHDPAATELAATALQQALTQAVRHVLRQLPRHLRAAVLSRPGARSV